MSESESFDFRENSDPELDAILYGFTNNANQYYNWLETKFYDNRYVLAFNREAADRAEHLSSSFAHTAVDVDQYFQNRKFTRKLLSSIWCEDEKYRVDNFVMLASDIDFKPLSKDRISRKISRFQKQAVLSPDDFYYSVKEEYGHSLGVDVARLLGSLFRAQEFELMSRLPDIPLSTPESTHIGLAAARIEIVRNVVAKRILNNLIDGDVVKYASPELS
jgi:hypothetical protein